MFNTRLKIIQADINDENIFQALVFLAKELKIPIQTLWIFFSPKKKNLTKIIFGKINISFWDYKIFESFALAKEKLLHEESFFPNEFIFVGIQKSFYSAGDLFWEKLWYSYFNQS